MAKIKYNVISDLKFSPKGKMPWIEINGEATSDSSFCIQRCNQVFNVDLDQKLSESERGTSRAFKILCEEHLYWVMIQTRWVDNFSVLLKEYKIPLGAILGRFIRSGILKQLYFSGMGRHSPSEIQQMGIEDIQSIAQYLGNKAFFLGSEPSEVDATIFAFLSNFLWSPFPGPIQEEIKKWINLVSYCQRMKDRFWPDWDSLLVQR